MGSAKLNLFFTFFITLLMCSVCRPVRADDVRYSHDKELLTGFNNVLVAIGKGDIDLAETEVLELKRNSTNLGYEELSEFSFRLIRSAKSFKGANTEEKRILKMAESLSPSHPGVLWAVSSFSECTSTWEQLGYLVSALSKIGSYPLTAISIVSRFLAVASIGIIISAFLVLLIVLVSSWAELKNQGSKLFSRRYKKVGGIIILFSVIILPGIMPLLLAMIVWSLFLTLALPRFWWLSISISLCAFYLEFLIEPGILLTNFAESPSSRALESIANNGFSPRLIDYVDAEVEKEVSNPVWQVILGQLFQSRGDKKRALEYYEKASLNMGQVKSIANLISFNKAVNDLEEGGNEKALNSLMELRGAGWNEFEVLYNISLASTLLHRTDTYESTFKTLQERFPKQLSRILQIQGEEPRALYAKLPNNFFIELLVFELKRIKQVLSMRVNIKTYAELGIYLTSFIFSLICGLRKRSLRYSRTFASQRLFQLTRNNKFWSYLPLGWAMQEGRMVALHMYLSAIIILCILLTALPIKLFVESEGGLKIFLPVIIFIALVSIRPYRKGVLDVA